MRWLLALLAVAAVACSSDETYQTGVVVRPSGLAYVEWQNDPAAPLEARGDLFIADPEVGGVNVVQLANYAAVGSDDQTTIRPRHLFVRSPSLFFPLVLPAPTYPTRVASSSVAGSRLYVLSAVDARLHVFGIGAGRYDASIVADNPYTALGAVELTGSVGDPQGLAPGLFDRGMVVDLAVLKDGGASGPDRVLLAVDDLGGGPSRLVELSVRGTVPPVVEIVATATVASGPRDLAVRGATPAGVWLSSAMTSSVSFVPLVGAERALGGARLYGVGGPTTSVVDAAESGAVALRLDRNSAVFLDLDAGGQAFARAARPLFSPHATGTEGVGEVALRSVGVVGAVGRMRAMPAPSGSSRGVELIADADRGADGLAPVVFVAYADGGGALFLGRPLRWPTQSIRPVAFSRGGLRGVSIRECPAVAPAACEAVTDTAELDAYVCTGATVLDRGAGFDAEYLGSFAAAPDVALAVTASTSSAAPPSVELALGDEARGFAAAAPGDRAFLSLPVQLASCSTTATVTGEGVVRRADADRVQIQLDGGALARALGTCGGVPSARVELFGAAPEFVVSRGAEVVRVTATATGSRVRAAVAGGLPVELSVTATASCEVSVQAVRACATDADCPGATCVVSSSDSCGGRCAACVGDGCWRTLPARRCPTVSLAVDSSASTSSEVIAGFGDINSALTYAVPEDVVFSPLRSGWFATFPGGRALGEVRLDPDGTLVIGAVR